MGLRFPTGTRQSDLSQPTPGADQVQQQVAGVTQQLGQLDRAPAAVTSEDLPAQAAPSPAASATPASAGLADEFAQKYSPEALALAGEFGGGNPVQGPPELPINLVAQQFGLVKQADGKYAIQQADGVLRPLRDTEIEQLKTYATLQRTIAPILGGAAAGLAASPTGPVGASLAGSAAAEGISQLQRPGLNQIAEATGGQPEAQPNMLQTGLNVAAGTAAGVALPGFLANSGLKNIAGAFESNLATQVGARAAATEAERRAAAVKGFEGPVFPEQINPGDPAKTKLGQAIARGDYGDALQVRQSLQTMAQQEAIVADAQRVLSRFPELTPERIQEFGPANVTERLISETPPKIAANKKLIYQQAGNRTFEAAPVADTFKRILDERSLLNDYGPKARGRTPGEALLEREYSRLLEETGSATGELIDGRPASQLTVKQLDEMTKRYQDHANFKGKDRTPEERAFGELAYQARVARDMAAEQAVQASNPNLAVELRNQRLEFQQKKAGLDLLEKALQKDPDNFTRAIVKRDSPELVRQTVAALPEESVALIRRQLLENAIGDVDEFARGSTASKAEKNWLATGDSALDLIYSKTDRAKVQEFFNRMKVLENKPYKSNAEAARDPIMKDTLKKASRGYWSGLILEPIEAGLRYMRRNQVARDYFEGKLAQPTSAEALLAQSGTKQPAPGSADQSARVRQLGDLLSLAPGRGATAAAGNVATDKGTRQVQKLGDLIQTYLK